jgi:diketogulonate reductase-like aldo/keto reductase
VARIQPSVVQSNSDILSQHKELLEFCATAGIQFQVPFPPRRGGKINGAGNSRGSDAAAEGMVEMRIPSPVPTHLVSVMQ